MYAIADSVRGLALARSRAGSEPVLSNNEASDLALIKAVAGGDRNAMRILYARHNLKVYRFILRLIKDPSLAEDLVSEVFLDVWRQAAAFMAKSQVSTWLLAIARNKAISTMRRRRDERLDEGALATVEDPACSHGTREPCRNRSEMPRAALTCPPRSPRSGLFPREVDRRNCRDHWDSGQHGQDPRVLRAQPHAEVSKIGRSYNGVESCLVINWWACLALLSGGKSTMRGHRNPLSDKLSRARGVQSKMGNARQSTHRHRISKVFR